MQITTKIRAKALVSSLRRELRAMGKSSDQFSHNECLSVMAKALGFASWNEWEASLVDAPAEKKLVNEVPVATPKYPLVNHGDFDFVERGDDGTPYSGMLVALDGTLERLQGRCSSFSGRRISFEHGTSVDADFNNGTTIFWDGAKSEQDSAGARVWLDNNGEEYSEAQLVFLPEYYVSNGNPFDDEDLPVRQKLVKAFVDYCTERSIDASRLEEAIRDVELEIGFGLTAKEEQALMEALI